MKTLKFGGTSLSDAKKFLHVSKIIEKKKKYDEISIVLSAPAKVTNYLSEIIKHIKLKKSSKHLCDDVKKIFHNIIYGIKINQKNFCDHKIINKIENIFKDIENINNSIEKSKQDQKFFYAKIISIGEIISIQIMKEILISKKHSVYIINPINTILALGDPLNATVKLKESKNKFKKIIIPKNNIILMPGFIAGNQDEKLVVLGRNGSDYSAGILSVCLKSTVCEIWTDVNGIYTTDPKIVSKAKLLHSLSYQEAIELSYFGAKVLHPKTITPLIQDNIICKIKNTNFPDQPGTIIKYQKNNINISNIKGITYLDNIIMLQIKISKSINNNKITQNILEILQKNKIHTLLNHYSYLKNIHTFYIIHQDPKNIKEILQNIFNIDIHNKLLKIINIQKNIKIISIIGNKISSNQEIINKIFNGIKYIQLNIFSIINTLSENSISIITDISKIKEAINIIHDQLFHKQKILEIFLIGIGGVGTALMNQFQKQEKWLKKKNIQFKICGISNSKNMYINLKGINLQNWKEDFNKYKDVFCIRKIITYRNNNYLYNPVVIDCTASQEISNLYSEILTNKISIVTPNKKANTGSWAQYQNIRKIAIRFNKKFLYETNVSAGLPIITTLRNLFDAGDRLISFQGILSGSLSYIFGKLEEGISITQSIKMAKKLGFTEPHPQDDLSGIDVARKLLIIAREAGYQLELKDIHIQSILPEEILNIKDEKIFLKKLQEFNELFFEKSQKAKNKNKTLRYVGSIQKGICQVKLVEIHKKNPLYHVKNGENALNIYSNYYQPIPLVFRGYGAGNNVTAAGIFSDLLQILS